MKPEKIFLVFILLITLFLNIYGINWGLPSRWNVDEPVTDVLRMIGERSLYNKNDFEHPTFYYFALAFSLAPYFLYLKISGFPIEGLKSAASTSWFEVVKQFPDFAANIFLISRFVSVILGVLCVYLVYKIGKLLFDRKAGLFSALVLALCMGFSANTHFAKSVMLVIFLELIVIYFCLKALKGEIKYIYPASFFAGLAFSTKYCGFLAILAVMATCILLFKKEIIEKKILILIKKFFSYIKFYISAILIFLGIFVGWPSILFIPQRYFEKTSTYTGFYENASLFQLLGHWPVGIINYIIEIIYIYGIPLSILIIGGIALIIKKKKGIEGLGLINFLIFVYLFLVAGYSRAYHPYTKYVIDIIPYFALFAGFFAARFLRNFKTNKIKKYIVLLAIFSYSFLYVLSADNVFLKYDTRYKSTEWLNENVKSGAKIEILNFPDWLFDTRLISKYSFSYFGINLAKERGNIDDNEKNFENYKKSLALNGPASRYLMFCFENFSDWENYGDLIKDEKLRLFFDNLTKGIYPYKLVRVFKYKNGKIRSGIFKGLSYPENILWHPKPSEYTAPTIFLFERIQA